MKIMKHFWKQILVASILVSVTTGALAFSLLGPFKPWQVGGLGYNLTGDIGGPMTPAEGFRWNVPNIVYAFDQSFISYYGADGMAAIEEAVGILNDLPPSSQITDDGTSLYIRGQRVPTDTRRVNFQAQALGLLDVKSFALTVLVEEMGLAEPERYVWTLRGRNTETFGGVTTTNYTVIKLNFDPITFQPSSFVNDVLYTYQIFDPIRPGDYAESIESPVDPLAFSFSSVAGGAINLGAGAFYTGLTRDDVGGLRFLYNQDNFAVENTVVGVGRSLRSSALSSPWIPFNFLSNLTTISTNIIGTPGLTNATNFVVTALRQGVDDMTFIRGNFDSLIGQLFDVTTNYFNDRFVSNGVPVSQALQRAIAAPDILFASEDLGLVQNLVPALMNRTSTASWEDNNGLNGVLNPLSVGPGVITPTVVISFTDQLPYFANSSPFLDETGTLFGSGVWASFDGTTNPPVIFPKFLSLTLEDLRRLSSGN